jgi:predicted nucleic acid-binding protein
LRVYLDTSSLLKTVRREPGSAAMDRFMAALTLAGGTAATSSLTVIEAHRALRALAERGDITLAGQPGDLVEAALAGIDELPVNGQVVRLARWIGPPLLRSLDAIHLASALLDGADLVVTYAHRLAAAAAAANIKAESPA